MPVTFHERLNHRTDLNEFRYRDRLDFKEEHKLLFIDITDIHAGGDVDKD